MKKNILKIAVFSLLAAAIAMVPTQTLAQEKQEKSAAEKKNTPKGDRGPFRGKVGAVDKQAKTIKVGERTFQITSDTKINKDGKPATLDAGVVGEPVSGYFIKGDDGKLVAKTVNLGLKPHGEAKGAGKKEKEEK
ncbi:MAG: hypothetical protein AAB380_02050 [Verrucomicrobiota bacterium]